MLESKMQQQQHVILKMHWYCNSVICIMIITTAFKLNVLCLMKTVFSKRT
jgi:hypothetical protein